jgi:hypothetical protein
MYSHDDILDANLKWLQMPVWKDCVSLIGIKNSDAWL